LDIYSCFTDLLILRIFYEAQELISKSSDYKELGIDEQMSKIDTARKAPIILIGGIPGVGKSSISGYVAREMGIDIVLSGDYLREFARPILSDENRNLLSTSVYEAWKSFGPENEENIRKGFLSQGEMLNRGLNAVLLRAIKNGEPMIVETLYFIPSQLDKEVLENTTCLYIYISKKEINSQRLLERENFTHYNSPGKRLSDQLGRYRVMMEYSLKECSEFGVRTFDNLVYTDTREEIIQYLRGLY
ncbi:MAG: AAA family ATPase, partial [Candidatus Thermoplasmatota archaeon]|nr:AAA family ATPase [Candidatus Thermoplasmatota archaeon]